MAGGEHQTPETQARPSCGCRARLKRGARGCGLTVLALLVVGAAVWLTAYLYYGHQVAVQLAQIRAAGEPTTLAEIAPKPVPDDQNAAVLYQQVFQIHSRGIGNAAELVGFSGLGNGAAVNKYLDSPEDPAAQHAAWALLREPEAQRRLELLRQASLRPDCVFPRDWDERAAVALLTRFREAGYWAAGQAQMLASQGHPDAALEWVLVDLRMARHAAMSQLGLIGELTAQVIEAAALRAAEAVLSKSSPSPTALTRALRVEAQIDPYASVRAGLVEGRARGAWAFRQGGIMASVVLEVDEPMPGSAAAVALDCAGAVMTPVLRRDEVTYLRMMATEIAAAGMPLRDVQGPPWLTGQQEMEDALPRWSPAARWMVPLFFQIGVRRDWTAARLRQFQIALELKLYRGQHGSYPGSLEELGKDIGHPLPTDPFSGQQSAYQRNGEGFTLNSRDLEAIPEMARTVLAHRRMVWEDQR